MVGYRSLLVSWLLVIVLLLSFWLLLVIIVRLLVAAVLIRVPSFVALVVAVETITIVIGIEVLSSIITLTVLYWLLLRVVVLVIEFLTGSVRLLLLAPVVWLLLETRQVLTVILLWWNEVVDWSWLRLICISIYWH